MATRGYVPDAGAIVGLQVDPQAGHEQAGHRPVLVISPASYNRKTGLLVCCPMTSQIKGHPFEVLTEIDGLPSAILSDQVKSLDWQARRAKKKGVVSAAAMVEVRARIKALLVIR
ncbi:MAG: endoribonuclease MazF [Betaproteobacteria bacterium]|jgi:mRNA interferase MazF|nr:endoribonuclease MazF [Betaproteobacteria bacterium]MBK7082110.1 endoribonuclease MazF [Betaproteobacteria bacterium]MBK7745531.1 endoribonuclease MazF [Betaproteobacteria bacterium]